jgi:hypothetical protein
MKPKRERKERKGKEATQSLEERAQVGEKEKGKVASAKEEERQQTEITRRVAGTDAPNVDPPSNKAPR